MNIFFVFYVLFQDINILNNTDEKFVLSISIPLRCSDIREQKWTRFIRFKNFAYKYVFQSKNAESGRRLEFADVIVSKVLERLRKFMFLQKKRKEMTRR